MTKENKFLPKLRFPEFEGVWKEIGLNSLLDFKNGINASKSDYGFGYKFINVLDIIENDFITHDKIIGEVNVTKEVFEKNSVQYGDILFQRSSETRDEVGQANVYLDKEKKATFGGFVIRGKKIGEYEPFFLNLLLKSSMARKEITSKSGGSTRFNVGQNILASIKLPFPLLIEQQKIASFLQEVDKKIDLLSKKITALETYKKGGMQKLFRQEIRFKQDDGSSFPDWEEKRLAEFCDFFSGGTPKSTNRLFYSGEIPFIGSGNISDKEVHSFITNDALKSSSAKMVNVGDLLYALYGATSGDVAISKISGAINQAVLCIRSNENLNYLYHLLKFNQERIVDTYIQGGQGNLSAKIVKELKFSFPTSEEQTKIANFLSAIDEKINRTQQQLQQTETFKKGLLQKMFV